jgi:uncharacterized protein YbaP (TraB family)
MSALTGMCSFLRLMLALVVLGLGGATAFAEPPIWVVKSHGVTITLFGSVHLLPQGLDWEPPRLRKALASADDVWFEIPIDDASNLAASQAALAAGMQPPGRTLSGQLSKADRARLARAAKLCGVSLEDLDRLKPWYADIALSLASYRMAGAVLADGVERQLSADVPPTARRAAFETPEQQIGYLSSASTHDQIASLRETLGEVETGPATYQKLVDAWMSGDPDAVRREALQPMMDKAPGVYRDLVVARNRRWVTAILQRLHGSGQAVIIVGVGHLVGPDSVPSLLRARGVEVDGPATRPRRPH